MSSEDSPRHSADSSYSTPSPPHSPMIVATRIISRGGDGVEASGKSNAEFYLEDSSSTRSPFSPHSSVLGSAASLGDVDVNHRAVSTTPLSITNASSSIPQGEASGALPPRPPRRVSSNVRFTADTAAPCPSMKSTALSHSRARIIPPSSPNQEYFSATKANAETTSSPVISNPFCPTNSTQNARVHLLGSGQINAFASPGPFPIHSNSFIRASSMFNKSSTGINRKPVPKVSSGDLTVDETNINLSFNHNARMGSDDDRKSEYGVCFGAGFAASPVSATFKVPISGMGSDPSQQIMKSTLLEPDTYIEKPWLVEEKPSSFSIFPCMRSRSTTSSSTPKLRFKKDKYTRISYFLSLSGMAVGVIAAAVFVYFSYKSVPVLSDKNLCLNWQEDWSSGGSNGLEDILEQGVWQREVAMGGFGNGEFEMTSTSPSNSFVKDNVLYIVPTLTTSTLQISSQNILNGYTYNLTGCTSSNSTQCSVVSNSTTGTMIPPVMSARMNTKLGGGGKGWMKYGRLEVKAKLPKGDWIWPAIWMLPVNDTYGGWPMSGEIDLMESRGNDITYPYQGRNYVRSTLNWGPNNLLNGFQNSFGWWKKPHGSYAEEFHTYAMEWTENFMRFYVDTRLTKMLQLKLNEPFFTRGQFPPTVFNISDSQNVAVTNPWEGRGNSAPFDQPFYLILNVAVGGTNGWFPDRLGNKPWFDSSLDALYNFANAQDEWYSTWPEDPTERGMAIESIKMYSMC